MINSTALSVNGLVYVKSPRRNSRTAICTPVLENGEAKQGFPVFVVAAKTSDFIAID